MTITLATYGGRHVDVDTSTLVWNHHTKIHNGETHDANVQSAVICDPSGHLRAHDTVPISAFVVYRVVDLQDNVLWTSYEDAPAFIKVVRYTSVAEHVWGRHNVEGLLRSTGKLPAYPVYRGDGLGPRFF